MAGSRQEYFILRSDVPIAKTNNFLKNWLPTLNADHVLKGELLVKETNPHDGSHAMYSLASDRSKKVSCINNDVAPLSKDDYEWLAAIQKPIDRFKVYTQQGKFEAVKNLQVGERVWVSLPVSDGTPLQLSGSSCCQATVQYIGPLQDVPGRWVGVETKVKQKEKRGSCDGSFRDSRYFMCEDGYGAFLSASNILTVSHSTSASSMPAMPSKKLLLSCEKTKSGRNFYEDDQVVVFDKDGRRVPGVAKWALPRKEYGMEDYIIGIETDMVIKKEKVEEHIHNFGHFFSKKDYKKHSYLAVPEVSVLKEGEGTPVDRRPEPMDVSSPPDVTESVRAAASTIAKNTRSTTAAVLSEQAKGFQEVEAKKVEAANKELADTFGVTPEELNAQREQYKKLERQQSENDQRREPYPGVMGMGTHGQGQEHFASSQGDKAIQDYRRSPGVNRRHVPTFERQGSEERQAAKPIPPRPVSHSLEVGSAVELVDPPGYGTIRWIGKFPSVDQDIAGVELDKKMDGCGDGSWDNERYFRCEDGHALFIVLTKLKPDQRFSQRPKGNNPLDGDLQDKLEKEEPCDAPGKGEIQRFLGPRRGIQGHQNSCYLDATLFAMFGLTNKFDEVICLPTKDRFAGNVLKTMCDEIVYPLRRNGAVRYDPVMKLREALDTLNRVKGLTHAEQDPEEFLNLLFKHVLNLDQPFIRLKRPSGLDTEFFFQLFLEPSDQSKWTVGEMLHKSMEDQQITFAEAPERLIIQLPRYGKEYKVYETVYPEMVLDISQLCFEYVPQDAKCAVCGRTPTHRCHNCSKKDPNFQSGKTLFFCESCVGSVHEHPDRQGHSHEAIAKERISDPVTLELISVVCIEKSHYVCFTRVEDSWVFFDSMADRTDDEYNIPEITACPEVGGALMHIDIVRNKVVADLHPLVRRLVKDASLCFYAASHADMYGRV